MACLNEVAAANVQKTVKMSISKAHNTPLTRRVQNPVQDPDPVPRLGKSSAWLSIIP